MNLLCASSSSRASGLCRTVAISISSSTVSAEYKRQRRKAQQEIQEVKMVNPFKKTEKKKVKREEGREGGEKRGEKRKGKRKGRKKRHSLIYLFLQL